MRTSIKFYLMAIWSVQTRNTDGKNRAGDCKQTDEEGFLQLKMWRKWTSTEAEDNKVTERPKMGNES